MSSWLDEQMAAVFPEAAAILGELITYTPRNSDVAAAEVMAIVNRGDAQAEANRGAFPVYLRLADLNASPLAGDRLTIGSETYLVVGTPELDGHGMVTANIRLSPAQA